LFPTLLSQQIPDLTSSLVFPVNIKRETIVEMLSNWDDEDLFVGYSKSEKLQHVFYQFLKYHTKI
jgi:hypothetical protein